MTNNAQFIQDRAKKLSYQAMCFPESAETAFLWCSIAYSHAERHGLPSDEIRKALQRILNYLSAERTREMSQCVTA